MRLTALACSLLAFGAAAQTEVPVNVGVGPAAYWFFGPVANERRPVPHFGLKLEVKAVLDAEFLRAHAGRVPARYARMAQGLDEVRVSPSILIPDALIISFPIEGFAKGAVYGITWRPLSVGVPLVGGRRRGELRASPLRVELEAGALLTYAFIDSEQFARTHFLRPGVDLALEVELALAKSFLLSVGWASQLYVPQKMGSFGFGPLDQSVFHVGQAFLKVHVRFPYRMSL